MEKHQNYLKCRKKKLKEIDKSAYHCPSRRKAKEWVKEKSTTLIFFKLLSFKWINLERNCYQKMMARWRFLNMIILLVMVLNIKIVCVLFLPDLGIVPIKTWQSEIRRHLMVLPSCFFMTDFGSKTVSCSFQDGVPPAPKAVLSKIPAVVRN